MSLPSRAPWSVLALVALLTFGAVLGVQRIEPEVDFVDTVPDHDGLPLYRAMLEELDGIRFVAVHMPRAETGPSLREPAGFDALVAEQEALTAYLEGRFPGAFSHQLSAYEAMRAGNYMTMQVATAGNAQESDYRLPDDATHDAVRDRTLGDASIDDVLAKDGSSALWLGFFSTKDNIEARRLSGDVADALADWNTARTDPATGTPQASGLLYSSHYTDERNEQDLRFWGVAAAGAVAIALLWVLRRPANILIAVSSVAVATTWTFGALGWLDIRISFLTLFLAPVVSGIGVDYAVHLLHRVEEEQATGSTSRDAVARALRHTGWPIALAALTTAAGLAVLLLVPAPLFAEIGGVASLGVLLGLGAALSLGASLRSLIPVRARSTPRRERVGPALARWATHVRSRPAPAVLVVLMVSLAAIVVAASQTTIESGSAENEFPQDDPVIQLQHRIEQEYGAFQRAYLIVRGDMTNPDALLALHEATTAVSDVPLYREASAVTALLLADEATDQGAVDVALAGILTPAGAAPTEAQRLPQTRAEAQDRLDALHEHPLWRTIAPFSITRDYDLAVVALQLDPWQDQQHLLGLRDALEVHADRLQSALGPSYEVAASGAPVNRAAVLEQTPRDVAIATVGSALAVGAVLTAAWSRRGAEGLAMAGLGVLLVLVSALWLIAAVPALDALYGVLGTANNAVLNDMFLLAFAITVAVGVDDLVHLVSRFWEARDAGAGHAEALATAFQTAGRAITGTTLTTFVAFAVLGGVYFLQSKNLALLTAAGVLIAYMLTLLLVPVALGRWSTRADTDARDASPA